MLSALCKEDCLAHIIGTLYIVHVCYQLIEDDVSLVDDDYAFLLSLHSFWPISKSSEDVSCTREKVREVIL